MLGHVLGRCAQISMKCLHRSETPATITEVHVMEKHSLCDLTAELPKSALSVY